MAIQNHSRRSALALGAKSIAAASLTSKLFGASVGDRVAVCVHLNGGADSNNMLVPLDGAGYAAYAAARGPLALPRNTLLPITSIRLGRSFGLNPALADLQSLFKEKTLAPVLNMGVLSQLMTKTEFRQKLSRSIATLYTHGNMPRQYLRPGFTAPIWAASALGQTPEQFEQRTFRFRSGVLMGSPTAPANPKFLLDDPQITVAINSVTMRTKFPNTAIGRQLEQAAKLIQLGPQLGLGQQIISCMHGGYDTHFAQTTPQQLVFTQLGQAIGAFNRAIQENRAFNRVTLFTQTEFNRTLAANSDGGSEHGWGGHNFVFGGSVLGGEMFGEFPRLALGGDDDAAGDGRFIPTTSLDQFGGTIVNWLGGNPATALPQLANFTNKNLGFLTA